MKFFKNSLPTVLITNDDFETTPSELYKYFYESNNYIFLYVNISKTNLINQKQIFCQHKQFFENLVQKKKSLNVFYNKNVCRNKVINYVMLQGKKLTAHRLYNDSFNLLYFFFERFNNELNISYDLYKTYYEFSKKNQYLFFEPIFIFRNLINFLQPSYMISFKKNIKKKKSKKLNKEIVIKYIKPLSRINFTLKSIIKFTSSFVFDKKRESIAYTLIYLFLSHKNSTLYKKKIIAYERLIKLKKIK